MSTVAASDNFRKNVREEAERRGMTHRDLAKKAKMHFVSLSRILNGKTEPSLPVAERIAKAINKSLEEILS